MPYRVRITLLTAVLLLVSIAFPLLAQAQSFEVLDVSERTLDDAPALGILFGGVLDGRKRYDSYLTVTDDAGAAVNGAWVLSSDKRMLYFPHIEPSKSYTVLIRRGLPSATGNVVTDAVERNVKTRPMPPSYGFASRGSVLPARLTDGLPVMIVNVPEVDVQFLRVKDGKLPQFINRFVRDSNISRWTLQELSPLTESVYITRFTTGAKRNTRSITNIPVEDIKELKKPGVYIAIMSRPGEFNYDERITHFFVSDIGLHARAYVDGTDVYTNSLASSRALTNVELELFDNNGKSIEKARTDNRGIAHLVGRPQNNQVLVARAGTHFSVIAFREPALDLSEFDVSGKAATPLAAFIYADRDLYRPGETAFVSVLLRNDDGRAVPAQPLQAVLRRADGKEMGTFIWQPQTHGYYQQNLPIPADAETGLWTLEVRADPAAKVPSGTFSFHVEEFLPERMKLDLASAQAQPKYDDDLKIDINGAYLYGAPATGNRFTAVLNTRREKSPVTNLAGFVFGDVDDDTSIRREDLPELMLDDAGHGNFSVRPFSGRPKSPMLVRVTGSLYESGGRPVVRSFQRIIWPAPAMIGIRPLWTGDYAPYNSTARFEVVRANADGQLLAAKNLDVKVIREDRNYYWSYDEQQGWHYDYSEAQYPIHRQSLDTAAGKRSELAFPVEWGSYRIEILDPESGLTARYRFQAGWDWKDPSQKSARPDRVVIKLDKAAYRAGDVAKVTLVPPHAGEAIVLVESDHVMWSTRVSVQTAGNTINVPIGKDWARHDLYLSAIVLRPAEAKERITPNRAMGIVHLPLDRSDRKLTVNVDAPKKLRPELPLKIKLKLPEVKNQAAMVTIAAVDVGILNITDFKTPDAFGYFFGKRGYGAEAYDLYGKVIENLKGARAKLKFGGDADTSSLRKDKRAQAEVKTVALFSGPVTVNANGEAEVSLALPDFNGTLRIMAVAFTDDRFGAGESEVVVAAPVVAEIATPRFLAPGDRSSLTLDVQNMSGQKQNLHVKLTASSPLVLAPADTTLTLDNQQKKTLRFDLSADQAYGVGVIELALEGQGISTKRRWDLGVRPAWPGERRLLHKALKPGETLSLTDTLAADLMDKTVEAQLLLSNVPPINIRGAVRGLLQYPYGCLEQTTSSAYPHVFIDEAKATELGLKPLSLRERAERLDHAIQRLSTMQLASGGFSLWDSSGPEETWLTPYVTSFLLDAREQGFSVPEPMLKRALDQLHKRLLAGAPLSHTDHYSDSPAHLAFAGNAYSAYVLARVQRAPLGTLRTLYDHHRTQAESGLPLVHLGIALKLMGDETRGLSAIREGIAKARHEQWYLGDYGSEVRDMALMYALLERHQITVNGKDKLLFTLAGELHNRQYFSTQEQFAIFLAGHSLLKDAGGTWSAGLTVAGKDQPLTSKGRWLRVISGSELRKGVSVTAKDGGTLYAELEVTGYPKEAPKPKQDDIGIVRNLYTPDGQPLGDRSLKVGEMLLAHLSVQSARAFEDGLVVDLLPAGLEVENLNISKGETLQDITISGVHPLEAMQANVIKHQEYRDDRFVAAIRIPYEGTVNLFYLVRVVSPGSYVVPPPYVEDMYRPEHRGIGTSTVLQVENAAH
ncbi:MAG: alpha-2-macroglobulin family protein [Gammaproteobacteria bacterium]|nr:alpha-2-macroglobulin family protein [Gammaproteobacteria bacterium]